ncbi:MAG: hypothetical protein LC737_03230, partial [Chloroflexi bacterium]|nr:hypothetical protein [Chloroflexota bacterium]
MRLLVLCVGALLVVMSLLGSGAVNFGGEPPSGVPTTITQWWGTIDPVAQQYQVDPLLVAAVMMQE